MSSISQPVESLSAEPRRRLLAGIAVVAGSTLASRVLGMLRDMATASLLGLSSGALDALIVAFRIPNLFRALFGEGALATCYLPVLAERRRQSAAAAWQTVTAVCFWLTVFLTGLVVAGEAVCALFWLISEDPQTQLLVGLSALLLPYLVLVCLAAQVGATLQAFSRFAAPAMAPAILNVVWLLAACFVAPEVSDHPAVQAYVLAAAILLAGAAQLAVQAPTLAQLGFRFQLSREASRRSVAQILPALCPAMLALAVTRINTLCDSLIAWLLAGDSAAYPLQQGAAGAIYCAERLCHLPIGLLGVSIATVVFPQLSRRAAGDDPRSFTAELIFGLKLVLLVGIPASAGLWLLAEPLARLIFARGEFTIEDASRTAQLVRGYSLGVWACCALPVLLRAYYALGDRITPLRVGVGVVILNLGLNLALVWSLGEFALALSTSLCAVIQCLLLAAMLTAKLQAAAWTSVGATLLRSSGGAAATYLAGLAARTASTGALAQVVLTVAVCAGCYALLMWRWERSWLSRRISG
jgi:putative peptidoglycan lipid II flippase